MSIYQTFCHLINQKIPFKGRFINSVTSFSSIPPSLYAIEHKTDYQYTAPISHSKHLLRLQPICDSFQHLLDYELISTPMADAIINFTGVFGNPASFLELRNHYKKLTLHAQSLVAITPPQLNLEVVHQKQTLPMVWMPWDRVMMNAYLQPPELAESELFALSDYAMSFVKNHDNAFDVLCQINQTIYETYTYKSGSTSLQTTPFDVYYNKEGVCQDFANLFISLARLLDIPARYRMGYLYAKHLDLQDSLEGATHAWAEVFLPYVGWIGFDPTIGSLADERHIKVACGRFYGDTAPTSGAIFEAQGAIEETLSLFVTVKKLN